MRDLLASFVAAAERAACRAATVCQQVQRESDFTGTPQSKAGGEPVTVADYASQAIILREIGAEFPNHGILAEENAAHLNAPENRGVPERVAALVGAALGERASVADVSRWIDHPGDPAERYRWAIDPIDGTKGFLRREQYAIAIGVLDGGEPCAGVLACPNLPVDPADPNGPRGVLFSAARGAGAFQRPLAGGPSRRIAVRASADPAGVRVLGSVEASHGDPRLIDLLVRELGLGGGVVRVDSQVKYGVLARGGAEVYLRPRSSPTWRDLVWDHAAGVLIALEAGGRASDMDGAPLDFRAGRKLEHNRGVLCTHGPLHPLIVDALRRIESAPR